MLSGTCFLRIFTITFTHRWPGGGSRVINPADEDGLWFVFTYVRRDCALCAWFVSLSVLSSFPYPVGGIRLLVVRA